MEPLCKFTADHAIANLNKSCPPEKAQARLQACLCAIDTASKNGKVSHTEEYLVDGEVNLLVRELRRRYFDVYVIHLFCDNQDKYNLDISWRPKPPKFNLKKALLSLFNKM